MDASVIVPVHNSEPYLEECLQSLAAQRQAPGAPLPTFEVICIDDGSTDGSAQTLERFASVMRNLRIISQPCLGVSAARNVGITAAQGDYLLFADADDIAQPTLLARAVSRAKELDAEMTVYGFSELYAESGANVPREMCEEAALQNRAFSLQDMEGTSTELVTPNVWRIAFNRRFISEKGVRFRKELRTSEDLAFIYECLFRAERIGLLDERLYRYRRDGGATLTRCERGLDGCHALEVIANSARASGLAGGANERHLVNLVLDVFRYALESAATDEEFNALYGEYEARWKKYVVAHATLVSGRYQPFFQATLSTSPEDYLWGLYARRRATEEQLRAKLAQAEAHARKASCLLDEAQRERDHLASSHAFRIGRTLTAPFSRARALLKRHRGAP